MQRGHCVGLLPYAEGFLQDEKDQLNLILVTHLTIKLHLQGSLVVSVEV